MKFATNMTVCTLLVASLVGVVACGGKKSAPSEQPAPGSNSAKAKPGGAGAEHQDAMGGHGVPVIQLGTSTIGAFDVKATRDVGEIVASKDSPIDVTVTPRAGSTAKATSVRFWIGTADAKGSVKARADIENPAEPNRWHTHAEIPNPIPAGSALWVEIEDDQGGLAVGSFDLKS